MVDTQAAELCKKGMHGWKDGTPLGHALIRKW
jgi:hypothetical protein